MTGNKARYKTYISAFTGKLLKFTIDYREFQLFNITHGSRVLHNPKDLEFTRCMN